MDVLKQQRKRLILKILLLKVNILFSSSQQTTEWCTEFKPYAAEPQTQLKDLLSYSSICCALLLS